MAPKLKPETLEKRRSQILEAALTCFTRKGYNNTTMDDIVAESGLSKGSLYWHFDSKDDLFASAITMVLMDAGELVTAALEQHTTASDRIRAMARGMVSFFDSIGEGFFNLFVEFWASSARRDEASQLWTDLLQEYNDAIVAVIEEGIRDGEFKPIDAQALAWAVLAAYDGLAVYATLVSTMDLERVSDVFVETLLRGLSVNEPAGGR